MPVMDGFKTCSFLREIEATRATSIIALTTHINTSFPRKCLEHGFTINKPFNNKELPVKIAEHLTVIFGV